MFAALSIASASYLVSVHRIGDFIAAFFGFHYSIETLAVQLAVPLAGSALDIHQQVSTPCQANQKKAPHLKMRGADFTMLAF
jgi:hypothetical protein